MKKFFLYKMKSASITCYEKGYRIKTACAIIDVTKEEARKARERFRPLINKNDSFGWKGR